MNGWVVLAGVTVALASALTWEIAAQDQAAETAELRPVAPLAEHTPPVSIAMVMVTDAARTVLSRPLFSPDRRLPSAPAVAAPSGMVEQEPPRLTGVIVGPFRRSAIFADGTGPPRVALEGNNIGRFTVQAIAPGQVTLTSPEGDRVLRPSFGNSPPSVPAAAAPARGPGR